jgi:hypothetical protein
MGNISDQIEYVPDEIGWEKMPREQKERMNKLYKVPIMELLDRWSKSQSYGEDGAVLSDDYWDIPLYLTDQLNVARVKDVNNAIKSIVEAIDALDAKLRNHRHDTTKQFSAKPEF